MKYRNHLDAYRYSDLGRAITHPKEETETMARMSFKPDNSFFRKIAIGAVGSRSVCSNLATLGHDVVELERGSTDVKLWKNVKRKRVRIPEDPRLFPSGSFEGPGVQNGGDLEIAKKCGRIIGGGRILILQLNNSWAPEATLNLGIVEAGFRANVNASINIYFELKYEPPKIIAKVGGEFNFKGDFMFGIKPSKTYKKLKGRNLSGTFPPITEPYVFYEVFTTI